MDAETIEVLTRKRKKRPPEIYTRDEIKRILARCIPRRRAASPQQFRARAIVALLWRTGMRIAECLSLKPGDLDLDSGRISILHGKGDRDRVVGIDPETGAVVAEWLTIRARFNPPKDGYLFCHVNKKLGQRLKYRGFLSRFHRICKRAGITKSHRLHNLRHTFTSELVEEGIPLSIIQGQLGHASIRTTARYCAQVNPKTVVDVIRNRPWEPEQLRLAKEMREYGHDAIHLKRLLQTVPRDKLCRVLMDLVLADNQIRIEPTSIFTEEELCSFLKIRQPLIREARQRGRIKFFGIGRDFKYLGQHVIDWMNADPSARSLVEAALKR